MRKRFPKWLALLSCLALLASALPASASNLDPNASFIASPSTGSAGSTFSFDASASTNYTGFKSGLQYRWDFAYNSSASTGFSSWSSSATTTHEYDAADDYTVALEVKNSEGEIDRTYMAVSVKDSSFNGYIQVDQTTGTTNTQFTFEAIITKESSISADDFEIRWDFDGDDTWDTNYSTALVTTHAYGDTGDFTPHLEIQYAGGDTVEVWGWRDGSGDDKINTIVVTSSEYPQGSVDVYPTSGTTNTEFSFDGSNSFDSQDYHDLEFRYDFEGDGIFDTEWSSDSTASHSYDTSGDWEPIMQVRDSDGNTDEVYVAITVSDSDTDPTAAFTITNDRSSTDKTVGTTSTTFTFNASSSTDLEDSSSNLQVRWDFNGDGDWDTTFSTTKTVTNRYLETGDFTVTVEVLDTAGNYDTDTDTVSITENTAPTAVLSVDPLEGTSGTKFTFDASDSSDDQYLSSYLKVRWDFEGDGTYDTEFSTTKSTTHYYEDAGTYDVTVEVEDPEGQTATASMTITVLSNTAPSANFSVSPEEEGTYSTLFSFDASDSSDLQTNSSDLQYRWDFNYGGESDLLYDTSFTTNPKTSHYFDASVGTGEISVRLEVKDEDDETSHAIKNISLHWASPYLQEMKEQGIMTGYTGGDMKPNQAITRAELTKMVLKAISETTSGVQYSSLFSDVSTSDWFWSYVLKAESLGIVSGYSDGTFGPNNSINRAEALKIILEAFDVSLVSSDAVGNTFNDVSSSDWYGRYVETASEEGLVSGYGDGSFGPGNSLTRGEAAKILYTAIQKFL